MSFRAAGRTLYRLGVEAAARFGYITAKWHPSFLRAVRPALKPAELRYSRNLFTRVLQQFIRRPGVFRPLAAVPHFRPHHYDPRHIRSPRFRRFIRLHQQKWPFLDQVQHIFATSKRYNAALASDRMPTSLDGYEIGPWIACGCNAAVYQLRVRNQPTGISTSNNAYPLALKIMFNYDFSLPERYIWQDMNAELTPLVDPPRELKNGRMGFRPLERTHPNIIRMYTAFIDRFPTIEGAEKLFPEALPSADIFGSIVNEPRTLFIVMKRYRMTLREYVLTHKRNYWTGRVMLGQLLEALVFLHDNIVSHRDLKSDNILLEFDDESDIPHLVIADFGCAHTGTFRLAYKDEFTDLGGNLSLRPPEIRRASPGTVLNYQLADLWAAGTLAYEIFTRNNPFYAKMSSETYTDDELPDLPARLHAAVKSLVYRTLRVNPEERPSPHVAANVVSMSLFRFGAQLKDILNECGIAVDMYTSTMKLSTSKLVNNIGNQLNAKLDELIGLYAAETISSRLISPQIISRAELQLRATFLSRVEREQLWESLKFFDVDENTPCDNASTISSGTMGATVYCN